MALGKFCREQLRRDQSVVCLTPILVLTFCSKFPTFPRRDVLMSRVSTVKTLGAWNTGIKAFHEDTCNSNVRVNMLYHLCVGIVAFITMLTGTNFRAERTQTKGDTTCNRTLELQVSSYNGESDPNVTHVFALCFPWLRQQTALQKADKIWCQSNRHLPLLLPPDGSKSGSSGGTQQESES